MIIRITTLACLLLVGCSPYPRYRPGGPETPPVAQSAQGKYTTNDYIRLGDIIQSYLGRPYRGASKYAEGIDCSLFAREVLAKFDKIELPRTVKDQFKMGREISRKLLKYGDLVFFKTDRNHVSHVGIYVGYNEFAHASTSNGVIISGMRERYWADRFVGARRILN